MSSESALNQKQIDIFIKIVEYYIKNGEPLGSKAMVTEFNLDVSPATVRNVMSVLEQVGFIEKSHVSSGRIPTRLGLEYYAKNLAVYDNHELKRRLEQIFLQRNLSIDQVIELAAQTISEVIGVTLITSEVKENELLISMQLIPLNETQATVIVVLSSGKVNNKMIDISSLHPRVSLQDLRIAIRIFNERLRNLPLPQLAQHARLLLPILANSVHNYEEVMQVLVRNVFAQEDIYNNHVYGKANLIKSENINRENLVKLLDTIEKQSIWDMIDQENEEENIRIDVRPDHTTFLSKRIEVEKNKHKELTFVGDDKMDYAKTKSALLLIDEFLTKQKSIAFENKNEENN